MCLIVAIPSTYIIRLVTGHDPPKVTADKTFFDSEPSKDAKTLLLGTACGAAVIKYEFNSIKMLYSLVTGGAATGVDSMSPSTVVEAMSMALDAFSIYKDLTEPERTKGWAAKVALSCTIVKLCRLSVSAVHLAASKAGAQNKLVDEAKDTFDVIAGLVVFALDAGVFVGDLLGDEDKGSATVSAVNTYLDTVSSVGYYIANQTKEDQPEVAAIGLIVCQATALEGVVTKGVEFSLRYHES